jgi:hypothetical protein
MVPPPKGKTMLIFISRWGQDFVNYYTRKTGMIKQRDGWNEMG